MNNDLDYWEVRGKSTKEDRYLWKNHLTYWLTITLTTRSGSRSVRKKYNLKTTDLEKAKVTRDKIITIINDYKGKVAI